MKIAFIGQKGLPCVGGGVEQYVQELSIRLVKLGHQAIVYTRGHYTDRNLKNYQGVRLISLPTIKTKHLDAITHTILASIDVLFRRVDVIHYQSIGPALISWLPKLLKPQVKLIATLQSKDSEHQKWNRFAKWVLKLGERVMCAVSDEIIVVTKPMVEYVRVNYGRQAIYLPNGAAIHDLSINNDNLLAKWQLQRGNYIVAISRLVQHKGLQYLIAAYQKLTTEKKLVIVGDGAFTDDYVNQLKEQAAGNDQIIFTNNQTGEILQQLYANAFVFVQPSESEGLSLALLEAMAWARPVIVSDISENLEAVANVGLSFINRDSDDLAAKLQLLLANPALAEQFGLAGLERVKTAYDWDKIANQMSLIYETARARKLHPGLIFHRHSAYN